MKLKRSAWILLTAGATALLITMVGVWSSLKSASLHGGNPDGSWIVTVTPSGPPNAPLPPPFQALITFTEEGSLVQTDVALSSLTQSSTTGHGEWTRVAPRSFAMKFMKLLSDATGRLRGTMKVRETIELSLAEDEYSGTGTIELLDLNGKVIASFNTATRAKRIQAELE